MLNLLACLLDVEVETETPGAVEVAETTAVAKASGGRISLSTIYRLNRRKGVVESFDAELLEALCDVFQCEPGDLLEREPKKGRR